MKFMIIEELKFEIPTEFQQEFIRKDALIWTALLREIPGFKSKTVNINKDISTEIIIVIYWQSRMHWEAIPKEVIINTIKVFEKEMSKTGIVIGRPKEITITELKEEVL